MKHELHYEPMFGGEFEMDEKNERIYLESVTQSIGRYPLGFRHYENFVNYKMVVKDATVQDYITEMNS
jgi:hypothetical protein